MRAGAAVGALAGLSELSFVSGLPAVSAAEATADPKLVRLDSDIEPLVRLIEGTERGKVLEEVAAKIKAGTSYQQVLAALQLAAVRGISSRPSVGFKFHAVLVVNSAHLAALASPDTHRWLPILWSIDHFKGAQVTNSREGNWAMGPVNESAVPPAHKARAAFIEAMENWDEAAADAAVTGLARTAGLNDVYELFWRFGSRDFRAIGHKAIFVANSFRTLQAVGFRHAEPILRSLAFALLNHEGDNPAKRDGTPDRCGRRNAELLKQIKPEWQAGRTEAAAATELLSVFRTGGEEDGPRKVVELLNRGVSPQSAWDAMFEASGELLMRQPGIVALHASTTTNAMRFAYETAASDETRRFLLLQNAAFLPMFRNAAAGRGKLREVDIEKLEPVAPAAAGAEAVGEIFADIGKDRNLAAAKTLGLLKARPAAKELMDAARLLIFAKGTDSHDYKFSSAVLEDFYNASVGARERFLAASMFQLRGSTGPDTGLLKRMKAAIG
jgi:hypothetical protein